MRLTEGVHYVLSTNMDEKHLKRLVNQHVPEFTDGHRMRVLTFLSRQPVPIMGESILIWKATYYDGTSLHTSRQDGYEHLSEDAKRQHDKNTLPRALFYNTNGEPTKPFALNLSPDRSCGPGIHVAPYRWVREHYGSRDAMVLLQVPLSAIAVMPHGSVPAMSGNRGGKFRVSQATVLHYLLRREQPERLDSFGNRYKQYPPSEPFSISTV